MTINSKDIMATLQEQFLSDPDDQMDQIELLALGFAENPAGALKDIMRVAHNLKGAAQLVGLVEFSQFVHQSETIFQAMSQHSYSEEDRANAASLIRRLGTLLRKKFEAIRDKVPENSREMAAWDVTLKGLGVVIEGSPKIPTVETSLPSSSPSPSSAPNQGWGVFEDTPAIAASPAAEPQGWGVFEDTPPTAVLTTPVQSAPAAPAPKETAHAAASPEAPPPPQVKSTVPIMKSSPKAAVSYMDIRGLYVVANPRAIRRSYRSRCV